LQLSSLLSSSPFFVSRLRRALTAGVWSSSFLGKGKREGDKHLIFWERKGIKACSLFLGRVSPLSLSPYCIYTPPKSKKKGCLDVELKLS